MNEHPLVSVIVPAYNIAPWLGACVSSILAQTFGDFELLLVDDGSTDGTGEICDRFASDSRVRVIHRTNGGLSEARNTGLDAAVGEFIAFVDGDDLLAPDFLEVLYALAEQGAEIAECSFVRFSGEDAAFADSVESPAFFTREEALREHLAERRFRQTVWGKLIRRACIGDLRFPAGRIHEDEFFTYRMLANARVLAHTGTPLYGYRIRPDSLTHTESLIQRLDGLDARVERHTFIRERFPSLEAASAKALRFFCLYLAQMALREGDAAVFSDVRAVCDGISGRVGREGCTPKEVFWLASMGLSLTMTARLRNFLGIGL